MVIKCVIASCGDYNNFSKLSGINRDADLLKQAIVRAGTQKADILHLIDFTRTQIFAVAKDVVEQSKECPTWLVFVALCHSYDQDGHIYLRAKDSYWDEDDFGLQALTHRMSPASGVFFIIASCRSRRSIAPRPMNLSRLQRRLRTSRNQGPEEFILFACGVGNEIPDDSDFVQVLSQSLEKIDPHANLHDLATLTTQLHPSSEVAYKLRFPSPELHVVFGDTSCRQIRLLPSQTEGGSSDQANVINTYSLRGGEFICSESNQHQAASATSQAGPDSVIRGSCSTDGSQHGVFDLFPRSEKLMKVHANQRIFRCSNADQSTSRTLICRRLTLLFFVLFLWALIFFQYIYHRSSNNTLPWLESDRRHEKESLALLRGVPPLPLRHVELKNVFTAIWDTLLQVDPTTSAGVGIQGMSGIGKSSAAIRIARDEKTKHVFPGGVTWIRLGPGKDLHFIKDMLLEALLILQQSGLNIRVPNKIDSDVQGVQYLAQALPAESLLVLDDAWNMSHVEPFLHAARGASSFHPSGSVRVLLTSRDAELVARLGFTPISIPLLTEHDSIRLLASWMRPPKGSSDISAHVRPLVTQVVRECGYLPLALKAVGPLIESSDEESWLKILQMLNSAETNILLSHIEVSDYHGHTSILKALQISIDSLERPVFERYLALASFSQQVSLTQELVCVFWSQLRLLGSDGWLPSCSRTLLTLVDRHLLSINAAQEYEVHELYHKYLTLRIKLDKPHYHRWIDCSGHVLIHDEISLEMVSQRCESIGGSLFIVGANQVESLDGLQNISTIGAAKPSDHSLVISSNANLKSLVGLAGLQGSLPGAILVERNPQLVSLAGLEGIRFLNFHGEDLDYPYPVRRMCGRRRRRRNGCSDGKDL